ncbi:amidinotransferase [Miniimonas arenae]|uniref:Amidinotransferase n=1 Tax=Miniimonas arenae TaxID=676201 RepID=A0A5C5BEN0_9MICO|nr:amidinotransferase [Miniimonas arenae]
MTLATTQTSPLPGTGSDTSTTASTDFADRVATTRRYLMCRPTYFDVVYEINPWMHTDVPVDHDLVMRQWENLRATYLELGHEVEVIEGAPGLPDMVYAANGATVVDGRALGVSFHFEQRRPEAALFSAWLRDHGFPVTDAVAINEGEGDFLVAGLRILAASGFRSDTASHLELAAFSGLEVVDLELVDPRYYHVDTALTVLDADHVAYLPSAFSPESRARLAELYPDAIHVSAEDAAVFGLNAVSDGRHVVVPAQATGFIAQLRAAGYVPVPVDLSELLKGGGSIKCCTLELRPATPAA